MIGQNDDSGNPSTERLIAAETEAAMAKFRASDFEAEVRKRVRQIPEPEGRRSLWRAGPAAAWVSLASAILIGVAILVIIPKKAQRPDMAQAIEPLLRLAPGIQALEKNGAGEPTPENKIASPMEQGILSALLAGIESPASGHFRDRSSPLPGPKRKARPLTLEETYKILIIDKSIERVLTLLS